MKKILVLMAALLSSSVFAAGNSLEFNQFSGYVGLNFASVSTSSGADLGGTTGWVLGGRAEAALASNVYFTPGAQFASRGFGGTVMGFDYSVHLTYLEFPVLFTVKLPSSGTNVVPYFLGGPNLGLKIGSGCSVEGAGTCTLTGTDHFKTIDIALELGAGAEFPLENGHAISAEILYHAGLIGFTDLDPNYNHRGVEILAGFHF